MQSAGRFIFCSVHIIRADHCTADHCRPSTELQVALYDGAEMLPSLSCSPSPLAILSSLSPLNIEGPVPSKAKGSDPLGAWLLAEVGREGQAKLHVEAADGCLRERSESVLKGSWDLVTRVIIKVTRLIITYNPN